MNILKIICCSKLYYYNLKIYQCFKIRNNSLVALKLWYGQGSVSDETKRKYFIICGCGVVSVVFYAIKS